jgi:hypothetical protein
MLAVLATPCFLQTLFQLQGGSACAFIARTHPASVGCNGALHSPNVQPLHVGFTKILLTMPRRCPGIGAPHRLSLGLTLALAAHCHAAMCPIAISRYLGELGTARGVCRFR